jgi:hypothetical protein
MTAWRAITGGENRFQFLESVPCESPLSRRAFTNPIAPVRKVAIVTSAVVILVIHGPCCDVVRS